jgi:uncharacterized protein
MIAWAVALAAPSVCAARSPVRERVAVEDVFPTPDGQFVVLLKTETLPPRYLPIWVGETEALNIRLRLDRKTPPRPLTLNLLEAVLESGRIKVLDIAIDDVKGGVFLGTVRLRQQGRTFVVDARPSDAIGLALGRGVPIFVSHRVIENAAIDGAQLGLDDRSATKAPKAKPEDSEPVNYDETL